MDLAPVVRAGNHPSGSEARLRSKDNGYERQKNKPSRRINPQPFPFKLHCDPPSFQRKARRTFSPRTHQDISALKGLQPSFAEDGLLAESSNQRKSPAHLSRAFSLKHRSVKEVLLFFRCGSNLGLGFGDDA
jgi:hypothetical protein